MSKFHIACATSLITYSQRFFSSRLTVHALINDIFDPKRMVESSSFSTTGKCITKPWVDSDGEHYGMLNGLSLVATPVGGVHRVLWPAITLQMWSTGDYEVIARMPKHLQQHTIPNALCFFMKGKDGVILHAVTSVVATKSEDDQKIQLSGAGRSTTIADQFYAPWKTMYLGGTPQFVEDFKLVACLLPQVEAKQLSKHLQTSPSQEFYVDAKCSRAL